MEQDMDTYLTKSEIYKKYKSEWILLKDPKTDAQMNVLGGHLLWHSKDRSEVYQKARELKPKRAAVFFTGKIAKGTAVIL
jgi:O-glycosyl hydrolase